MPCLPSQGPGGCQTVSAAGELSSDAKCDVIIKAVIFIMMITVTVLIMIIIIIIITYLLACKRWESPVCYLMEEEIFIF